ncbi:hypothetical protein SDC9_193506 [bioreactor metagenome]|uniref:Uncharacterized protein n=1 Tax=bioreactor metagenome TaxID=1076179 RepID=A0A645I3Q6_9ZZZZ
MLHLEVFSIILLVFGSPVARNQFLLKSNHPKVEFAAVLYCLFCTIIQVEIHSPALLEGIALVGAYLGIVPFYRMSASVDVVFVVIVRPVANRLLDRFDGSLHKG